MRSKIDFVDVIMALIIVAIVAFAGFSIYCYAGTEVVEIYSVGCEVSQLAYAEKAESRSSSKAVYKMGVRCDDFATTLNISSTQFAQFVIGDIVEVEVTEIERVDGVIIYEYRLLGPYQE